MKPQPLAEILRQKIREDRTANSLHEFAQNLGITYGVLWRFMTRPKYSPTLRIAQKLCDHFDLELVPKKGAR